LEKFARFSEESHSRFFCGQSQKINLLENVYLCAGR